MKKITYKIYTLGCKVNQYDSASLGKKLESWGYNSIEMQADLAIINTCAVTKTAIRKAKRMINQARKENPGAKLVLLGCWPQVYPEEVKKFKLDLVSGVGKFSDLLTGIKKLSGEEFNEVQPSETQIATTDRSRYFIKIQDGCNQFCAYCVIPYARGRLQSRNEEEIIAEVKAATSQGFAEIVLSGIHLGLYGVDSGSSLYELLKKLIKIEGLGRLRLSSIEVGEISDQIIKLMAESDKICKHLHIPLQGGVDKILKAMRRPYTTAEFSRKIMALRQVMPDIAITTDVIVGFPGETAADFQETKAFIVKTAFSRLHIFPFSAHEKTPAFSLPDQVSANDKKLRVRELWQLNQRLEKNYREKFWTGQMDNICVAEVDGNKFKGLSEHYLSVSINKKDVVSGELMVGQIVRAKLD